MSLASHIHPHPSSHWRLSQQVLLTARNAARVVAKKLNANPDYDVRMYEAIAGMLPWSSDDVVFDVGANDGRTIFRLMRHLPAPRIVAFEPASSTFRTLTEQTRELDNVERHRLALGDEPERRTMYLNDRAVLNSLDPGWGPMHGTPKDAQSTEEVEVTTLDRFVAGHDVHRVHLLKIDTEGHDLKVLEGAEEALRNGRIDIIQIEVGFQAPGRQQPSLYACQKYLREFDYHLYGIYNQCRSPIPPATGRTGAATRTPDVLVFCDALFVSARAAALETPEAK